MKYDPTWNSLKHHTLPDWFRDGKFGIYTHWGPYSVPACGPNGTWYTRFMYQPGTEQYDYHVKTYGPPETFGYKEFIPMFTADKFDPDEWADLFKRAGAQFAGPVAEHHDGFSMWDSKINRWNAVRMGPKRDVVGELASAIKGRGMKYVATMHHSLNWWFFATDNEAYDCADPEYRDLYTGPHGLNDVPDEAFLKRWRLKLRELVDGYEPDLVWFDTGLSLIPDRYRRDFLAYYYNRAEEWGRDVVVTYKENQLVPGSALTDLELGKMNDLTYFPWLTDTSVDALGAWSYVSDAGYKPVERLVHNLVDRVSKNGYLLLNVGPRADGSIPQPAVACLEGMGKWLDINGEAIFGTTPWLCAGEGPTKVGDTGGHFNESNEVRFTANDIRFTSKGSDIYAVCLGQPGDIVRIKTFATEMNRQHAWKLPGGPFYDGDIRNVSMLGGEDSLHWRLNEDGLLITVPEKMPCDHAVTFKISLNDSLDV